MLLEMGTFAYTIPELLAVFAVIFSGIMLVFLIRTRPFYTYTINDVPLFMITSTLIFSIVMLAIDAAHYTISASFLFFPSFFVANAFGYKLTQ